MVKIIFSIIMASILMPTILTNIKTLRISWHSMSHVILPGDPGVAIRPNTASSPLPPYPNISSSSDCRRPDTSVTNNGNRHRYITGRNNTHWSRNSFTTGRNNTNWSRNSFTTGLNNIHWSRNSFTTGLNNTHWPRNSLLQE